MKLGSTAFALMFAFGVTTAIVACTDEAEEARQAAAKAEADEQEAFLDQYCQIILPCCNKILSADVSDVAGCKTRLRTLDPVTVASKQARTDCITQAKLAAPSPKFCPDFDHAKTPSCPDGSRKDLVGTKKVGEVCATNAECAPDFTGIVACAAGVCQLRKRGAEGDGPCDTTIDGDVVIASPTPAEGGTVFTCYRDAPDGLQCNPVTNNCEKPVAERGECEDHGECLKTHYCADPEDGKRRCFPRQAEEQRCDVDAECQGRCGDTGFCGPPLNENDECTVTANCPNGTQCVDGVCTKPGADARLAASCVSAAK